MGIFADMVARGCERNVITYSSLIRWAPGPAAGPAFESVRNTRARPRGRRAPTRRSEAAAALHPRVPRLTPPTHPLCVRLPARPPAPRLDPRSAAEKAGRTDLALQLFERMHQEGCRPNVVTYNSLIAACSHGARAGRMLSGG
jgi:pentatricopeptide repeat protein